MDRDSVEAKLRSDRCVSIRLIAESPRRAKPNRYESQMVNVAHQYIAHGTRNLRSICGRVVLIDRNRDLSLQDVPDPSGSHRVHPLNARYLTRVLFDLIDDRGIDRIHQAIPDAFRSIAGNEQDRDADQKPHARNDPTASSVGSRSPDRRLLHRFAGTSS